METGISPNHNGSSGKPLEYNYSWQCLHRYHPYRRTWFHSTPVRVGWHIQGGPEQWNDYVSQYPFFTVDARKRTWLGSNRRPDGWFTIGRYLPKKQFHWGIGNSTPVDDIGTTIRKRERTLEEIRESFCWWNLGKCQSQTSLHPTSQLSMWELERLGSQLWEECFLSARFTGCCQRVCTFRLGNSRHSERRCGSDGTDT